MGSKYEDTSIGRIVDVSPLGDSSLLNKEVILNHDDIATAKCEGSLSIRCKDGENSLMISDIKLITYDCVKDGTVDVLTIVDGEKHYLFEFNSDLKSI